MAKKLKEPRYTRTIAVPASIFEPADVLAKELEMNMNTLIVEAIREYVERRTQLSSEVKRPA